MERALCRWEMREGQAVAVLGTLVVLVLALFFSLLRRRRQLKLHLPPRPFLTLPLLGDVLHVRSIQTSTSLERLRNQLGPIFTLYVSSTPIIFVSSAVLAHEALVEKGLLFAARPQLPSRALFTSNFRSISSASYGPHWRIMRRNLVQEMLSAPKILSLIPIRRGILHCLVSRISAEAEQNEGVVELYPIIRIAMFQLLLFMCFGFEVPLDALLEISNLINEMLRLSRGSLAALFPFLRVFEKKTQRQAHALRVRQVQIFTSHVEKHKELAKHGQLGPGSYLETLLHMDAKTALSMDDIVTLCTEFLVGGIDTTVTTLEWTMACLVTDPQIQSKLYNLLSEVCGNGLIDEGDLPNVPYLRAVIKETLRLHPPGHFVLPHAVSEPCKLGGYDIPANAIVHFHIASISRDSEIWDDPLKFKPERFSVKDVDITGTKEVRMIPFGAGRRICPGLGLASMHLELFVARLVQNFVWAHPSGTAVDLDEKPGFTVRMKYPLRALVKKRGPSQVL
ncbi:hypothetical protein L7F22_006599 [Adiantum nelumboides]|nr:hypothetical protein [Adiantum nelumboides]